MCDVFGRWFIYPLFTAWFCVVLLLLSAVNQLLNQQKWAKYESAEETRGGQRFMSARETWPWELVSAEAAARPLPAATTCFRSIPQFSLGNTTFWTHHKQNTVAPAGWGQKRLTVKNHLPRSPVAGRQNRLRPAGWGSASLFSHTHFQKTATKSDYFFRISCDTFLIVLFSFRIKD